MAQAATPILVSELDSFEELVARTTGDGGAVRMRLRTWLANAEAWRIREALRECNGNRTKAARLLGIGRRTLYNKMEKLCLVPTWTG
jgi:DNA-binding NtrC family response regulator